MRNRLFRWSTAALTIAVVLIAAEQRLMAASCWSAYEDDLKAANNRMYDCVKAIPLETMKDAMFAVSQSQLCGAAFVSDSIQAETEYGVCMAAGAIIGWFFKAT